jgi:hypothetical protein
VCVCVLGLKVKPFTSPPPLSLSPFREGWDMKDTSFFFL